MTVNRKPVIDMEAVVASRLGGRKPPRLLVAILKRHLRIDFINSLIDTDKTGVECLNHIIGKLNVSCSVEGLDAIQDDGRKYVFASNHPLGGIDGAIESALIAGHFPKCGFLCPVNSFLMFLTPLKELFVPINMTGAQSRELPSMLEEAYKSDNQLLVFPAGLCSRMTDGVVRDIPWKKSFIREAIRSRRWIVPVRFIGENSRRFYRVANICKRIGLKFNFAMSLLPDEVYRGRNRRYRVIFGKPVPPTFFDSSRTPLQWAEWVKNEVYKLN